MNEALYIALSNVLLYTQSALHSYQRISPQPPPVCNIHLDDVMADTEQWHQCIHNTPAIGGQERVKEPIKWMGIIRSQWGKYGQDTRVTPLLFTRTAMGFLMTIGTEPRFNVSSEGLKCFCNSDLNFLLDFSTGACAKIVYGSLKKHEKH